MTQDDLTPKRQKARGPTGAIRRAYLAMQRCGDAMLSPRRTTTDQFSLLWILRRQEGIRQNELANELFSDANTVTAMLARLEGRGLIHRQVCNEDGRARRVHLTPAGRRLVERLSADWEPIRRTLSEIFAGEAGQEALRVLEEVRLAMMEERAEVLEKRAMRKQRSPNAGRLGGQVRGKRVRQSAGALD